MRPYRHTNVSNHGGVRSWRRLLLVAGRLCPVQATVADDALVLPHGVVHVAVDARLSLSMTERLTPSGGTEDLATDVNRALTSTVCRDVRVVEAAVRLPAGAATRGRSVVDVARHIQIFTLQAAYGCTDRLSLGVPVPS
jgi:hypothetical protein